MKVLVTGVKGQLGHDVVEHLIRHVTQVKPDAVIHCAAYTAVDQAESDIERCCRINGEGTKNLVRAAVQCKAKFLYVSTDYVFPGNGEDPYEVDDPRGPKNIYGQSKMQGEVAVTSQMTAYFIVRTSWVYGVNGNNFVRTMLKLGADRNFLNVVDDQIGSPTYSDDLARLLVEMIQTNKYGVYHATNEGFCSWAEFAREIMMRAGLLCEVRGIPTSQYKTPAQRPLNSRLSKKSLDAAGFSRLPHWEDALQRYLDIIR